MVALALVAAGCLAWSCHAAADEFRAVVVTDQESAALRAAKARADEAQVTFTRLREATEERYRARLNGALSLDWSTDFRVIAERRWLPPSNLQWLQPQPLYQPGGWSPTTLGRLTWPSGEPFSSNAVPERGVNAIDWSAPLGSVRTEWDGVIHGSVGEPITLGVVPGAVAQ